MHRTGKYKKLNMIFGIFPFIATVLLSMMREDSPSLQLWLSIVSLRTVQPVRVCAEHASASDGFRQCCGLTNDVK